MIALILISLCSVLPVKEGTLEREIFVFQTIWFVRLKYELSILTGRKKLLNEYLNINEQSTVIAT